MDLRSATSSSPTEPTGAEPPAASVDAPGTPQGGAPKGSGPLGSGPLGSGPLGTGPEGSDEGQSSIEPGSDPRFEILAQLTVASLWVARIGAPALRGWRSGIEAWMTWADAAASLLSQLLAIVGVMFVGRTLLNTFSIEAPRPLQKLLFLPAGFGVVAMLAMACQVPLDPTLSMSVAGASGLAALAIAPTAFRYPETRAAGLAIATAAAASLMQALARRLALQASADALTQLYAIARALATAATLFMVIATALGFVWLSRGNVRSFWVKVAVLVVVLALIGWGALAGSVPGGASWQVLIDRAVQQVDRHPRALLPGVLLPSILLAPLVAATIGLVVRRTRSLRAAVVLALASGLNTDLAPLAMALVGAGAIVALEAERCRTQRVAQSHGAGA